MNIKHIWFDFSETIAHINKQEHSILKYATYAKVVGKPVNGGLKDEFDREYEEHNHSISDIFYSLGKPANWWSSEIAKIEPLRLYHLAESDIPEMFLKIKGHVPISIFSNIDLEQTLPALGINPEMFEHILSSGMVSKPKPALDGFYKMVELSKLKPNQILYIGDDISKDILPAKEVGIKTGLIWSESDKADYCFNSFDEILKFVK